jgi:membrane protease YdiL (CAAX protease family)
MGQKNVSLVKGIAIYALFTGYFFILLYILLPIIKNNFVFNNPIMYWIIIGYFLFVPIFFCSIIFAKINGNNNIKEILSFLNIKHFSKKDWKYSIIGLFVVVALSGLIYGGSFLMNKLYGIRLLTTHVWFMEIQPLQGQDYLIFLLWLPMFFFNIFAEELLWRGYIQSRSNKNMWFIYSIMWLIFHIPFGIDLVIFLVPIIIIIPFIFSKQKNTLIGCLIHGLFNGPTFVLVLLGIVK